MSSKDLIHSLKSQIHEAFNDDDVQKAKALFLRHRKSVDPAKKVQDSWGSGKPPSKTSIYRWIKGGWRGKKRSVVGNPQSHHGSPIKAVASKAADAAEKKPRIGQHKTVSALYTAKDLDVLQKIHCEIQNTEYSSPEGVLLHTGTARDALALGNGLSSYKGKSHPTVILDLRSKPESFGFKPEDLTGKHPIIHPKNSNLWVRTGVSPQFSSDDEMIEDYEGRFDFLVVLRDGAVHEAYSKSDHQKAANLARKYKNNVKEIRANWGAHPPSDPTLRGWLKLKKSPKTVTAKTVAAKVAVATTPSKTPPPSAPQDLGGRMNDLVGRAGTLKDEEINDFTKSLNAATRKEVKDLYVSLIGDLSNPFKDEQIAGIRQRLRSLNLKKIAGEMAKAQAPKAPAPTPQAVAKTETPKRTILPTEEPPIPTDEERDGIDLPGRHRFVVKGKNVLDRLVSDLVFPPGEGFTATQVSKFARDLNCSEYNYSNEDPVDFTEFEDRKTMTLKIPDEKMVVLTKSSGKVKGVKKEEKKPLIHKVFPKDLLADLGKPGTVLRCKSDPNNRWEIFHLDSDKEIFRVKEIGRGKIFDLHLVNDKKLGPTMAVDGRFVEIEPPAQKKAKSVKKGKSR